MSPPQSARARNLQTAGLHYVDLPVTPPATSRRLESLDLARGFAIVLMILSHGVKGLLDFRDFPTWGLVPIHLVTKFSSSLFIMIFGISLAVAFLPDVGTERWAPKRKRLIVRGLVVLFWYKVLTIVEMFHLYKREDILATLKYQAFPSYVEILGYYGIVLLWIPIALSLYKILPLAIRVAIPAGFAWLTYWLSGHPEYFASPQLQALLIEHDDYYTWGQLSRAPLVFAGLLIGEAINYRRAGGRWTMPEIPTLINYTGLALLFGFLGYTWGEWGESLRAIALNKGKHPPEMAFMLFSLAGALLILGACLRHGKEWAGMLAPVTLLGKDALGAFVFHAFVLFVFYRYLFDLWLKVSYPQALLLALALVMMSAAWVKAKRWVRDA